VIVWFSVLSVLLVAIVFRSPAIDYRTVILGALLPWVDAVFGGPRLLHSVLGAVGVMVLVIVATPHKRVLRRRLLGIPIGMMCHLVLDGSFTLVRAFWWPVSSRHFASGQVPELRHVGVSIALELVGIAVAVWAWGLFGLNDPARRERFLRDGRLELPES